jgi:hypothetical protein
MKTKKIDYLMFKIRGRLVKVDPDIYYKIRSSLQEKPYKKYTGDITEMRLSKDGYPIIICGTKPRKYIQLSRFVMDAKEGQIVDHIYGDPLDNRKINLRIVTPRQNGLNRKLKTKTGFVGVYVQRKGKKDYCVARFQIASGKAPSFSLPDSPENRIIAAFARDKFVLQAGEEAYAPLNFPCFKNEPFKSFLLEEDLNKYRKRNRSKGEQVRNIEN